MTRLGNHMINIDSLGHTRKCPKQREKYQWDSCMYFIDIGQICEYSRLTVKTATETVDNIKQYDDLYSRRGGGLEASLDLHAKMSLVMTLQCERRIGNINCSKWEQYLHINHVN